MWGTHLSIRLGGRGLSWDLRTWVNSGLMTFFFLVVGLEARREFDLGELRERRRFILPLCAGLAAMAVPVLIYLVINHGRTSAHGWGAAMSTDTALASACWPCWVATCRTGFGPSCSLSSWSTTSSPWS